MSSSTSPTFSDFTKWLQVLRLSILQVHYRLDNMMRIYWLVLAYSNILNVVLTCLNYATRIRNLAGPIGREKNDKDIEQRTAESALCLCEVNRTRIQ